MIIDHDHLWSCYYYLYVTPDLIHVPINLAIPGIPRPGHPCAPRSVRSIRSSPPPQPWTAPRPAPGHRDRPAAGAPGRAPWPAAPGGWRYDIWISSFMVCTYIYISYIYISYYIYIYHLYHKYHLYPKCRFWRGLFGFSVKHEENVPESEQTPPSPQSVPRACWNHQFDWRARKYPRNRGCEF